MLQFFCFPFVSKNLFVKVFEFMDETINLKLTLSEFCGLKVLFSPMLCTLFYLKVNLFQGEQSIGIERTIFFVNRAVLFLDLLHHNVDERNEL